MADEHELNQLLSELNKDD